MHTPRIHLIYFSRYMEGYKRELEHFVEQVVSGGRTSITDRMVLAVFKICTACEKSGKSGEPVEIKWDPEEVPKEYSCGN